MKSPGLGCRSALLAFSCRDIIGRVEDTSTGELAVAFNDFYTVADLRKRFHFTKARFQKFAGEPDATAIGQDSLYLRIVSAVVKDVFTVPLYQRRRIDAIESSPEYRAARAKWIAADERAALKREQKRQEKAEREAAERTARREGCVVYLGRFESQIGYIRLGVLTRNEATARKIFKSWLADPDCGKQISQDHFDEARDDHQGKMEIYREEVREWKSDSGYALDYPEKPERPLRSHYTLRLVEVVPDGDDIDPEKFEADVDNLVDENFNGYYINYLG